MQTIIGSRSLRSVFSMFCHQLLGREPIFGMVVSFLVGALKVGNLVSDIIFGTAI